MFKNFLAVLMIFAGMALAYNPYGYSSTETTNVLDRSKSSTENQVPVQQTQYEDYRFAIAAHPLILCVWGMQGILPFFITFESGFGRNFSLVTRPVFFSGTYKSVAESGFGLIEGFRFYLSGLGHRGWYLEPEFQYVSVEAHNSYTSASGGGMGLYLLFGYKVVSGRFVFGMDSGVGYNSINISSDALCVKTASTEGFGFDVNMYFGYAF